MMERELKLYVPEAAHAAIGKALRAGKAMRATLHARYYDTAARELANANIALRLRKEGRRWMQTAKAPGADALSRLELNHARPQAALDLDLYTGTALGPVFAGLKSPLALRYETRVTRLVLRTELPSGVVEIAYDRGVISAGGLELPISEIEFELLSGDIAAVFDAGEQWLQRHGLIIDLRSKAERGDALANAASALALADTGPKSPEPTRPAAHAQRNTLAGSSANTAGTAALAKSLWTARRSKAIVLKGKTGIDAAYRLCAHECLGQIIQNTAYAAGVDTDLADDNAHVDYVHQLRVGIRRLRSCWKLFKGWVEPPEAEASAQLRDSFGLLGGSRDSDVIKLQIEPQLLEAGLPAYKRPRARHAPHALPESLAAGIPLQTALLRLLRQLIVSADSPAPARLASDDSPPPLRQALTKRLNRWLKKIAQAGSQFESLPMEAQHDLRKAAKSLRYCLEFSERLLGKSELRSLSAILTRTQSALGDLNDYYVAESHYRPLVESQPQTWFAIGWLRAMQSRQKARAQALFKKLRKQGPLGN